MLLETYFKHTGEYQKDNWVTSHQVEGGQYLIASTKVRVRVRKRVPPRPAAPPAPGTWAPSGGGSGATAASP